MEIIIFLFIDPFTYCKKSRTGNNIKNAYFAFLIKIAFVFVFCFSLNTLNCLLHTKAYHPLQNTYKICLQLDHIAQCCDILYSVSHTAIPVVVPYLHRSVWYSWEPQSATRPSRGRSTRSSATDCCRHNHPQRTATCWPPQHQHRYAWLPLAPPSSTGQGQGHIWNEQKDHFKY